MPPAAAGVCYCGLVPIVSTGMSTLPVPPCILREAAPTPTKANGALQIGEPAALSDAEMDVVLEKFRTYGQQR